MEANGAGKREHETAAPGPRQSTPGAATAGPARSRAARGFARRGAALGRPGRRGYHPPVDSLEPRSAGARVAAALAYLAAVALLVLLQEVGLRLRREERRAWWAGNGRDLLNAVGFAAVVAALRAYGFPLPAALGVGGTLTLLLFGTSIFVETRQGLPRPRMLALLAGLGFAAPVLFFPGAVLAGFTRVAAALFRPA